MKKDIPRRTFLQQGLAAAGFGISTSSRTHANNIANTRKNNLKSFAKEIQGQVFQPLNPRYEDACRLWTGSIPKRPSLVVCCSNPRDVAKTIRFAQDQNLALAVRGGGHTINGTCEGGILINLSHMSQVKGDPDARTVNVQAGALTGAVDHATAMHGLATVIGECPTVGISGLTLGGGLGRLMGQHGALCDNLLQAKLVTADGSIRKLSSDHEAELFWAIKGGSGNFGVVTEFKFKLHPVKHALAGMLTYPLSQAQDVLQFMSHFMKSAPDTLDALIEIGQGILQYGPQATDPSLVINVCCTGNPKQAENTLRPLRQFGTPLRDNIQSMSYFQAQALGDVTDLLTCIRGGHAGYRKSGFITELSNEVIENIVTYCQQPPSQAWSFALDHYMHGEICRQAEDACAFNLRRPGFNLRAAAFARGRGTSQSVKDWVTGLTDTLHPHAQGHIYLNYLTDQGESGVRAAFGSNYRRLLQLKKKYDPNNLFHHNHNIKPMS